MSTGFWQSWHWCCGNVKFYDYVCIMFYVDISWMWPSMSLSHSILDRFLHSRRNKSFLIHRSQRYLLGSFWIWREKNEAWGLQLFVQNSAKLGLVAVTSDDDTSEEGLNYFFTKRYVRRCRLNHDNSFLLSLTCEVNIVCPIMLLVLTILGLLSVVSACSDDGASDDQLRLRAASSSPQTPPSRPLQWGDVNIIHTTDTHGWLLGHQKTSFPEPNYRCVEAPLWNNR